MNHPRNLLGLFARDALVSTLVAAIALGPAALPALAGPQGFDPRKGNATLNQIDATHWEITAPDGSIIQYSSFDIAASEAVKFLQPGSDARVLNRILSALPTRIDGSLTGNGHIYIVNPAGVFFGDGAVVNANAIHAAGGNLSDTDFTNKVDRYTSVGGPVQNAGEIRAKAVSLVGETVVNSGQIIAEDGWIVIAAGNDVLVGRDDANGPLLRIEGGAGAVFDPAKTGVTNTGTIEATGTTPSTGIVKVGAGDLYGTAIFSNQAIHARELALAAGNRGDVALAGDVNAEKLDISFRGTNASGQLRSAVAGETTTLRADDVKLSATGTGQSLDVASDIAFRSQNDAAVGPTTVTMEQSATLASSSLAKLDIGTVAAGDTRNLGLRSTAGNVVIDDKAVVAGSNLALVGTLADIKGTDALNVASLAVAGATTAAGGNVTSAGDIVASTGGITVQGNLQLTTKPNPDKDPAIDTLVSAHNGTLHVDGNVTTSAGGPLRIEAQNVDLGKLNSDNQPVGGVITSQGDLKIGFVDAGGVQQTQNVKMQTIDTRGATGAVGGNVDVAANGNVAISTIVTNGGAGSSATQPNKDGGSVSVRAGDAGTLTIGAVATGGADTVGRAAIDLSGGTVVLTSGLDASGGQLQNGTGARDRAVSVRATSAGGQIQLGTNSLAITGSDIDLDGAIRGTDLVQPADTLTRRADLNITASGTTNLRSTADLHTLTITSKGDPVVLGGDVHADTSVKIGFNGSGIGTIANGGSPVTVSANRVELTASDTGMTDGRSAAVALGDGIDFDLFTILATSTAPASAATLALDQDAAIDSATATRLADAALPASAPLRLELHSNDAVTLDAAARAAVTGTDLVIASQTFAATGATQTATDFDLSSLDLATRDALDVDFGVTADSVRLAGGSEGQGDLTLRSALQADTIALVAGNGPNASGTSAKVLFGTGASLRSTDGSTRPDRVDLIQDAAIDSADLPDVAVFGGSVAGLAYGLESRDASVTLSAGTSAKFGGSALELRGRTGVNLGSEDLSLASLIAETPAGLVVSQQINATAPDGKIRLRAGSDGVGDLEIGARLAGNTIELVAGSGNGTDQTSRIVLDTGARFSAATGDARPDHFTFEQDAAIGGEGSNATAVPDVALFGGDITGMEYALRSTGASVRIDSTASVNGTKLILAGKGGVDVNGNLGVAGLDLTGDTTLSGNLTSTDDVTVRNKLTLDGTGAQTVAGGAGDLTALDAIAKSGAGALSLSGAKVEVAAVTTGRTGDSLTITGTESVTTGALDASGLEGSAGGNVSVSAISGGTPGKVVVASITTRGGNGKASQTAPEDGKAGGTVAVTGSEIAIGNVNTGGGNASAITTGRGTQTRNGGNAGAITLDAPLVTLSASLDARGGTGSSSDPAVVADHAGHAADVDVNGAIRLAANTTLGELNAIRGDHVTVAGGVTRADTREVGQTALAVTAQNGLGFGGNLTADRIDLELANGNLALGAAGPLAISANTIRLAATDGNGKSTTGNVDLTGVALSNEVGGAPPKSLTIDQDLSIGAAGSPLPPMGGVDRTVALISHDGAIDLDATDVAAGTKLTLAANGLGATGPAVTVNGDLDVAGLTIGNVSGSGVRVDGDALIDGNLVVGTTGLLSYADLLDVTGNAAIGGNSAFAGTTDQVLRVGAGQTLALGGGLMTKSTTGKLTLDADSIRLTAVGAQTIENSAGQLEIGSANGTGLVKGAFDASGNPVPATLPASLTLIGSAKSGGSAIVIHGTQEIDGDPLVDGRDYAVAVADGDLTIDAQLLSSGSTTTQPEQATWSAEGDVLAFGDMTLLGRGVLAGGKPDYAITARRAAQTSTTSRGGQLAIVGLASADGDLALRAEGHPSTDADPNPSSLFLGGDFETAHRLTLSGTTEALANTTIHAGGDVTVEDSVVGSNDLSISSDGVLVLRNDVTLDGSAFSASGGKGILLTSAEGTQTIEAGSITLGSGDAKAPKGKASILRQEGDLKLHATKGSAKIAKGQRLQVAGNLDVSAKHTAVLADTAALSIDVSAPDIQVRGGADVVANRISVSNRPSARGPGSATFATPTRDQFSGDLAGSDVFLRQISADGAQLDQADLAAGNFPTVDGPALFEFATQVPRLPRPASIVRPRADVARLAEAKDARPLWADELLVYLDARSRRAPTPQEQGALPPVSAGPNATTPDTARETASPAVEHALPPYRALFRPATEVDPETGIVQGEDRTPEIRAAFARAVAVASSDHGGAAPTAADVAAAIERDPSLADARAYRADLGELVSAANRALDADQRVRFREILLARVTPKGIAPAEFNALIP
jgi:filamentous hemagglutinin family protein